MVQPAVESKSLTHSDRQMSKIHLSLIYQSFNTDLPQEPVKAPGLESDDVWGDVPDVST